MWLATYLGKELELGWCDEDVWGYTIGEHHLRVLLPLDGRGLVAWVKRVESALLKDGFDAFLDLSASWVPLMSRCAQVFDDISIDHSECDFVDSEHLWVAK